MASMATAAGVASLTAKKHFTTEDTEVTETDRRASDRGGFLRVLGVLCGSCCLPHNSGHTAVACDQHRSRTSLVRAGHTTPYQAVQAAGEIRTPDPLGRSQVLSSAELRRQTLVELTTGATETESPSAQGVAFA